MPTHNDPFIGTLFAGKYHVIRVLGKGGFATVYYAICMLTNREVALKIFNIGNQVSTEEFYILDRIRHPNIIEVYEVNVSADGYSYMAMYCVSQGTAPSKKLPLLQVFLIATQVLDALDAVHSHGLVHRDIKPQNILLDINDKVLLSDFGITRQSQSVDIDLTEEEKILGTVHYMAPEQFDKIVSRSSDIYALGICLYQWITGHLPFTGSYMSIILQHSKEEPVPPFSTWGEPFQHMRDMEEVILKALAKNPEDRFASVKEFKEAFTEAMKKRYLALLNPDWWPLQNCEEALPFYNEFIRLYPDDGEAYCIKGDILESLVKYEEALSAYNQAILLNPHNVAAYRSKGAVLYKLRRIEEALAVCNESIRLFPGDAMIYFFKGAILLDSLSKYEDALVAYNEGLRFDPNNANAHLAKGRALYKLHKVKEATAAFHRGNKLKDRSFRKSR